MRRSFARPKKPFVLEEHLNWYVLAATAAGVGVVGSSQGSEAKIIYTKAHRHIVPNNTIKLDLNHDGVADFRLKDTLSSTSLIIFARFLSLPIGPKNEIVGHVGFFGKAYASALPGGIRVGPKAQFLSYQGLMAESTFDGQRQAPPGLSYCTGPWANVSSRYLGLRFTIKKKEVHFGWARVNVTCLEQGPKVVGLLTGYAYETVPNRPIVTGKQRDLGKVDVTDRKAAIPDWRTVPQPGSLGRLAQGALGLGASRRLGR